MELRARTFWAEADVDQVFEEVLEYLDYLKSAFKKNTATDKGENVSKLLQLDSLEQTEPSSPLAAPLAGRDGLAPLAAAPLQYEPHDCCPACLPGLPSMPQSTPPFWGQNPLKVPLLCGFHRLSGVPVVSPGGGGAWEHLETEPWEEEEEEWDVVYKAPCGKSLRCYDEVMHFLLATESYGVLQVDFFSFNAAVRCDPPRPAGPRRPELDLSRGAEPTPVELCVGEGGLRPDDFRYRKDRWPHGCFLSRGPALFAACCDCTDGCWDAANCACVRLTRGGRHYSHHRLSEPVPSGLYECGPWCGCDGARCQNRLVQRGIRVRLQVFRTADCGWGVRCRDDLDQGTFVCTYAGLVLGKARSPVEAPPPKLLRAELASDDEVEVQPAGVPATSPPTSPPLHVPVIQRPAEAPPTPQDRDKVSGSGTSFTSRPVHQVLKTQKLPEAVAKEMSTDMAATDVRRRLKRPKMEDVYFLDASKEGNVGRFLNHSCQPNLFVQNVFTDSHDHAFPVIAFFTSRSAAATHTHTHTHTLTNHRHPEVT
uniref:Histone-lysine N-methyltransferase SETDB2 n=1 Tax=Myripristis murdjan TaxID=586833 RepID=A0A668A8B8_9TELE